MEQLWNLQLNGISRDPIADRKQRSTGKNTSCRYSSEALQNLSQWNEDVKTMWVEAEKHVEFRCEIYAQARCHRWFATNTLLMRLHGT